MVGLGTGDASVLYTRVIPHPLVSGEVASGGLSNEKRPTSLGYSYGSVVPSPTSREDLGSHR